MVLPEPVSPTMAVRVPAGTSKETSCERPRRRRRRSGTRRRRRRRRRGRAAAARRSGRSSISTGRSRYSKTRSKSASDVCTSIRDREQRADREEEPRLQRGEGDDRAERDVAGEALPGEPVDERGHDREASSGSTPSPSGPAMRCRTSRSASSAGLALEAVGELGPRPIVLPSRIPETESDSSTSVDMSAIVRWRVVVIRRRSSPTRRVSSTKTGSSASEKSASRQSSRNIATTAATTVVTFETIEVAVEVTTLWTPPMSFAIRDWTSPVRVRREERERQPLQVAVDGGAQVVHDLLADDVREPGLQHAEHAGARSRSRSGRRRAGSGAACRARAAPRRRCPGPGTA